MIQVQNDRFIKNWRKEPVWTNRFRITFAHVGNRQAAALFSPQKSRSIM